MSSPPRVSLRSLLAANLICFEDRVSADALHDIPSPTDVTYASIGTLLSLSLDPSQRSIDPTVVAVTRVAFRSVLTDSWERATGGLLPLAFVPLLSGVLGFENVLRILAYDGYHAGVRFALPAMVVDVWTFVSVPTPDGGVHVLPYLPLYPIVVALQGLLGAGLLGSIHQAQSTSEYRFLENVSRYGGRLLLYAALVHALTAPFLFATLSNPAGAVGLLLLAFPVGLALWYCFFAAPYLVVVDDARLLEALGRSFELAVDGGAYFEYARKYFLFVAAVSLFTTIVAVNLPIVGLFAALVATAPLALALTVATVRVVTDFFGDRSTTAV